MPLLQGKKKINYKIKVILFMCEATCNAAKKRRLFSNLSSREFNFRNVGGTSF